MPITTSPIIEDYAEEMVHLLHQSWRSGTPLYKSDAMWDANVFVPHPNGGMISQAAGDVWYMITPHMQAIYEHARRTYSLKVD